MVAESLLGLPRCLLVLPELSPKPGTFPFPLLVVPITSPPCCGESRWVTCFLWYCPHVSPGHGPALISSTNPSGPLSACGVLVAVALPC